MAVKHINIIPKLPRFASHHGSRLDLYLSASAIRLDNGITEPIHGSLPGLGKCRFGNSCGKLATASVKSITISHTLYASAIRVPECVDGTMENK
jgi:hypothetical protein